MNKYTSIIFQVNLLLYLDFIISCGTLYNQNRYYYVLG